MVILTHHMKWEQMKHWNYHRTLSDALHYLCQLGIWDRRWRTQALTQDWLHLQCDWGLGLEGHNQNPKRTLGAGPWGNGDGQGYQFMSNNNFVYQSNAWQYCNTTLQNYIIQMNFLQKVNGSVGAFLLWLQWSFFVPWESTFTHFWKLNKRSQVDKQLIHHMSSVKHHWAKTYPVRY